MVTKAVLRYIRISPRKFRLVIPLVKGKQVDQAVALLSSMKKKAASYCIDLINHAIANTKRMHHVNQADLYISKLIADGGPQLKRFRAASMGRSSPIRKRTSHITIELDLIKRPEAIAGAALAGKEVKKAKTAAPAKETSAAHHKPKAKKGKG